MGFTVKEAAEAQNYLQVEHLLGLYSHNAKQLNSTNDRAQLQCTFTFPYEYYICGSKSMIHIVAA